MALAVLVGMLVSVTLTPALLAVVGRAALWPAAPHPRTGPGSTTRPDTAPLRKTPGPVVDPPPTRADLLRAVACSMR
jgi:uncharacterized membrane protein YdfJ with MMPL/SSD domain